MSKRTQRTVVPGAVGKKVSLSSGEEKIVVIQEESFYTFKNIRQGPFFFKREDGKEDLFRGEEEKDDITEREAMMLRKCRDYKNGWLIEVTEDNIPSEVNSFTDEYLEDFLKNNNAEKVRLFIDKLTNEIAIKRVKDAIIEQDMPVSLALFCDYKIGKIQEEIEKSQETPVDLGTNSKIIDGEEE